MVCMGTLAGSEDGWIRGSCPCRVPCTPTGRKDILQIHVYHSLLEMGCKEPILCHRKEGGMRSLASWPEIQIVTQAILVPTLMLFYPYLHSGLLVLEFIHTTFFIQE